LIGVAKILELLVRLKRWAGEAVSGPSRALASALSERRGANEKALALLGEHLSDTQRSQFVDHGFFEVFGSQSGARYRIYQRRPVNVFELNSDGWIVRSWCFYPIGRLPLGDVLLAQKIALEHFEREALAVANEIRTFGIRVAP
jgi:hypothetical protein